MLVVVPTNIDHPHFRVLALRANVRAHVVIGAFRLYVNNPHRQAAFRTGRGMDRRRRLQIGF